MARPAKRPLSTFGKFIRRRMRELGIPTSKEVAEAVGVAPGSFNHWLRAPDIKPRDEHLLRLAAKLQLPLAEIHAILGRRTYLAPEDNVDLQAAITLLSQVPDRKLPEVVSFLRFQVEHLPERAAGIE